MSAKPAKPPVRYQPKVKRHRALKLSPAELTPHPLLERVSMLPDLIARSEKKGKAQGKNRENHKKAAETLTQELNGVRASIRKSGIRERLKVVKDSKGKWLIADGRHRWMLAQELGLSDVPCEEITPAEVVAVIMDGVQHRHMSKGGRAYLAVLTHPEVATEEKRSRGGIKTAENAELMTAANLAEVAGVSPRMVEYAVSLFKSFSARQALRKKYEPGIWIGQGLDKIIAAIEAEAKDGSDPEAPEDPKAAERRIYLKTVERAKGSWTAVTTALKSWDLLERDDRADFTNLGVETVLELPREAKVAIREALNSDWEDQL